MRPALALLVCLLASPATALADGHVLNDAGKTATVACTEARSEVVINGASNTLTLTGPCTKVVVNGARNTLAIASAAKLAVNGSTNTIAVDAADKIAVTGNGNTVTWKRGLTGKAPKVAAPGTNNSIKKSP